jgi:phosphatidylglycerol:prolipoprotein diacylglycerol transferase
MGAGVAVYMTELWRDNEGRGTLPGGALSNALDGPQIAAIAMVLVGAIVLCERKGARTLSEAQHG